MCLGLDHLKLSGMKLPLLLTGTSPMLSSQQTKSTALYRQLRGYLSEGAERTKQVTAAPYK